MFRKFGDQGRGQDPRKGSNSLWSSNRKATIELWPRARLNWEGRPFSVRYPSRYLSNLHSTLIRSAMEFFFFCRARDMLWRL